MRLLPALVAAISWIPFIPANAQVAGTYEPFTHQANAKSWLVYDYADGTSYVPDWDSAGDGVNPDIYFTFAGSNALDFYADAASSHGAFVGDLAAGGVDAIGCDYYVEDSASFDSAEFFLYSATDQRFYVSNYFVPGASGWNYAYASLSAEDWYYLQNGSYVPVKLTPEILGNITEAGFTFHPANDPAADGKMVALDNFSYYGAYILPKLTTGTSGSSFQLSFDRRPGIAYSIQSSPDLSNWTLVPGEESITGSSPYMTNLPITPGPHFFRVGIEDFLTPVPDMTPP